MYKDKRQYHRGLIEKMDTMKTDTKQVTGYLKKICIVSCKS